MPRLKYIRFAIYLSTYGQSIILSVYRRRTQGESNIHPHSGPFSSIAKVRKEKGGCKTGLQFKSETDSAYLPGLFRLQAGVSNMSRLKIV